MATDTGPRPLRVAIEGCGHGTLDAIYESIKKSCELKGWDGVDLVIICGDFQAVRDRLDLNVTAMPPKYRQMADFHQYYWGNKTAPYLTIFIGGNHEASNHLWELYYGGWAAPNIYYLGAANVIRVGPLKIAGLSGIWKGYDYQKPHYERLPYSNDDMYSIYHVRELDVRKLLSYRTQVDIGLSHDWPRGIEWLGNHQQLFRYKTHLREDAEKGSLGSVAASKVLDHLRPHFWYSAHLHTRYTAVKRFATTEEDSQPSSRSQDARAPSINRTENQNRLSAWNNFHLTAQADEAEATTRALQEQKERRYISDHTGVPLESTNVYNEVYKKVKLGDDLSRTVTSVYESSSNAQTGEHEGTDAKQSIPQFDGCCTSLPVKRRRNSSPDQSDNANHNHEGYTRVQSTDSRGDVKAVAISTNPDAIDLDLSDEDDDSIASDHRGQNAIKSHEEIPLIVSKSKVVVGDGDAHNHQDTLPENPLKIRKASDAEMPNLAAGNSRQGLAEQYVQPSQALTGKMNGNNPAFITALQYDGEGASSTMRDASIRHANQGSEALADVRDPVGSDDTEEVSEEMRAQLAALSTKFAETEKIEVSPSLPHPEAINNTSTRFLALSKCAPGQHFLQLMEVIPHQTTSDHAESSLKLGYDPEWLAILRGFASELTLGSSHKDPIPPHQGETYYRNRILEEEKWIQQHVVDAGLLDVPNNFQITLPRDEFEAHVNQDEMPVEATNPQTSAFCKLIGIDNKFDFSQDDREARKRAGPAPSRREDRGGGAGGGAFRGGHGGRGGRGGRGRDGHGRGHGRGGSSRGHGGGWRARRG